MRYLTRLITTSVWSSDLGIGERASHLGTPGRLAAFCQEHVGEGVLKLLRVGLGKDC